MPGKVIGAVWLQSRSTWSATEAQEADDVMTEWRSARHTSTVVEFHVPH
jgi:hypothetical protein